MKCDDVFDLLTAVSLTAEQRVVLEDHLSHCTSCCQLAEAFSPAVELLEQVMEEDRAGSLHTGQLPPWFAVPASHNALPPVRSRAASAWLPGSMALACMLMVGVLVGIVMQYTAHPSSTYWMARQASPNDDLSALALSPACWQKPSGSISTDEPTPVLAAPQHLHELQCCTFCHSAGKDLRGTDGRLVSLARLEASCLLCHVSLR